MLDRTLNSICARAHRLIPEKGTFDCEEILSRFPELQAEKDLLFEIALEEYRRRQAVDSCFDKEAFFAKFASHGEELRAYISVHQALESESFLTQMESALEPTPGMELGDYLLLERLGRGAFGQVFLARQLSVSGRLVVVKLARIVEKEVHALSQLSQCKHIVPVYTVSRVDDWELQAICMPYLGRVTMQDVLDSWIRGCSTSTAQGRFDSAGQKLAPPPTAESIRRFVHEKNRKAFSVVDENVDGLDQQTILDWRQQLQTVWEEDLAEAKASHAWSGTYRDWVLRRGIELLDALHEAHRRKLLHCDVKPSNVLINDRGEALLFDFNLTKGCDSRMGGGTLPYMAPEQLRVTAHEPGDDRLTVRTDLFAWGVTIIQMLCGELPFGGFANLHSCDHLANHQAKRLLARQKTGRNDWEALLEPLPPKVISLIVSAIAFKPVDRPESARCLASSLRDAIREGRPIGGVDHVIGTSSAVLSRPQPQRLRKPVALGVAFAIILFVSGGLVWGFSTGLMGRAPWVQPVQHALAKLELPALGSIPQGNSLADKTTKDQELGTGSKQDAIDVEYTEEGVFRALVGAFIQNREMDRFRRWQVFAGESGIPNAVIHLERSFHDAYNLRFSEQFLLQGTISIYQTMSTQALKTGEITLDDRARMIVNEWDRWLSVGKYYELSTKYTYEDIRQVSENDIRSSYYHCLATKDLLDFVELISDRPPQKRIVPVGSQAPKTRQPEECLQSARRHLRLAFEAGPTTNDIYLEKALLLLGEAYLSNEVDVRSLVAEAGVAIDQVEGILPEAEIRELKLTCRDFPQLPAADSFQAAAARRIEAFNDRLLAANRRFSNRRNASHRFRNEFEKQTGLSWNERHKLPF